jgi:hypothetical protein
MEDLYHPTNKIAIVFAGENELVLYHDGFGEENLIA